MMDLKRLPIGIDNFEKLIKGDFFYVDKTLFIKEIIDTQAEVTLVTRPRRFGKSLNMSMLRHFFEIIDADRMFSSDTSRLFDGLKIMGCGSKYVDEKNKYPVILITLKDADRPNFSSSKALMMANIISEYDRHCHLLKSDKLSERNKEIFSKLYNGTDDESLHVQSLKILSQCLEQHYGKKAVILIDEYDVPLESAYFNGYYNEMVKFIRILFGNAFKTNNFLAFAVLTGCLRVSRTSHCEVPESIFTGLNNLRVVSIVTEQYGEYFGFTEDEVQDALTYYGLDHKREEMREWYNGYVFGNVNVYNPWSAIMYLVDMRLSKNGFPLPYWSNTSSNNIIRELIEIADEDARDEIENLIRGGSITKPIHEDIVYGEIKKDMDNLWNFLFFTGYLKLTDMAFIENVRHATMTIPNIEVCYIYKRKIREWFNEKIKIKDRAMLLDAIMNKDVAVINDTLNQKLMDMISFHDSAENFYHGFLLGILGNVNGYAVKSNRESGTGRSDIYMKSTGIWQKAVIFECKMLKEGDDPEEACRKALRQIEDKNYDHELVESGYKDILKYAVVFRGKRCLVMAG